ncbi:MAG: DUF4271 domain-containing protein [Bacteroidia bacterium]|nr:DUF4271 domain-containing protein [Bacteroidia bacterium]
MEVGPLNVLILQLDNLVDQAGIVERVKLPYQWIFLIGVMVLILVGVIRTLSLTQHQFAIRNSFANVKTQFEYLDKEGGVNPVLLLQILVSCIVIGLGVFLFLPFDFNFTKVTGFRLYLLVLMGVCLAYTLKYFTHYITGLVLQSEILGGLMVVGLSHTAYAFTLGVFPLLMTWYYVPSVEAKFWLELILALVLGLFLVWRLVKSFFVYNRYFPFAKIYIIIYLCTLEITPLLILGKFLVGDV